MENKWIKIRPALIEGKYELWNAKSNELYGIDLISKKAIEENSDKIKNEDELKLLLQMMNDEVELIFNFNYFEIIDGGINYIILSKDNANQYVVNESTYDICLAVNNKKVLSEIFNHLESLYYLDSDNKVAIVNTIIDLSMLKIILIV